MIKIFPKSRSQACKKHSLFDYLNYLILNNVPTHTEYIQMDIHPAEDTLKALQAMPIDKYRFSIITYDYNRLVKYDYAVR